MLEELWVNVQETILTVYKAFLELSSFKRMLIIVFVVGVIPAYFLSRTISHSFWQNSFEKSYINARPSFTDPKAISASAVTVLSTGGGVYSAIAQIENQNLELVARIVPYKFSFYNKTGQQVYVVNGSTFLTLNQQKYLVVSKFTSSESVTSGKLEFGEVVWQKRFSVPEISLVANTPITENELDPLSFVVSGQIHNNSPYGLAAVRLTVLLENSSGQIIAVSSRDEFSLKPNERRAYKVLWPGIYSTAVARVRVFPETNVLDNNNINSDSIGEGGSLERPKQNR